MRALFCIALAAVLTCAAPFALPALAGGNPVRFVAGFDDLPLMPGLAQEHDGVTIFESPYGRIAESWASGPVARADVLAFYGATLPQLGWARTAETTFKREGEELTLDITEDGQAQTEDRAVLVRFHVSPDS